MFQEKLVQLTIEFKSIIPSVLKKKPTRWFNKMIHEMAKKNKPDQLIGKTKLKPN
jgi:hypothetical protein